mmetsp:Transcript_66710/g.145473  ORF Transcript_66710/g.145473 Transcript_66710/m.145473 type:complete len:219 (-) Transcript_66710:107-763(-)
MPSPAAMLAAGSAERRQKRPVLTLVLAAFAVAAVPSFVASALRPSSGSLRKVSRRAGPAPAATEYLKAAGKLEEMEGPALPSQLEGLSEEELKERRTKALDIWESMKVDIKDILSRYQTFRPDKFEEFMRTDTRGRALFQLYKPGTPEYAEFFEEVMGPFVFEIAKEKMGEGLGQAGGVILVVGGVCAFLAFFGTDIIQFVTQPFSGLAQQFVEQYGF